MSNILEHPQWYVPADNAGHRLGTLVFQSDFHTFVFQMHEATWASAITYTGYATPQSRGPISLLGFTATTPSLGLLNSFRPSITFSNVMMSLTLPTLGESDVTHTTDVAVRLVSSPLRSSDGESPDSYVLAIALDGVEYHGTITNVSEGFLPYLIAVGAIVLGAAIIDVVSRSDENSDEREREKIKLVNKAIDKGYKVEYSWEGGTGGSGSTGAGGGELGTQSGGTLVLTPPSTPPGGGTAPVTSASGTAPVTSSSGGTSP